MGEFRCARISCFMEPKKRRRLLVRGVKGKADEEWVERGSPEALKPHKLSHALSIRLLLLCPAGVLLSMQVRVALHSAGCVSGAKHNNTTFSRMNLVSNLVSLHSRVFPLPTPTYCRSWV